MIDCLSNPTWINPQIDFLLFLQNFRLGYLEIFDKFFLSITIFGEFWLPTLICAIVYWCIDFRSGLYLFTLEGANVLLVHLFKMMACVYRPWILNDQLKPSSLAVPFAKGYSFPSGHTGMSSSVLGGLAYVLRNKKFLALFLCAIILLVGFSRLWLGVHTPQDVLCGLLIGIVLIFSVNRLINWAEKDKNRYLYLAAIVDIFALLALIYIFFFNVCRIDYVNGKLLVNPQSTRYATVVAYGFALGVLNGTFLCRRFCPFNPKDVSPKRRVIRGIIGFILVILLLKYVLEYAIMNTLPLYYAMTLTFLSGIFITLIYPLIFTNYKKLFKK